MFAPERARLTCGTYSGDIEAKLTSLASPGGQGAVLVPRCCCRIWLHYKEPLRRRPAEFVLGIKCASRDEILPLKRQYPPQLTPLGRPRPDISCP